jgi:hypothetical protein
MAFLLGLGISALAVAMSPMGRGRMVMDSLRQVPPRLRARWLDSRGLVVPGTNAPAPSVSESTGLRLVGKYGRGPSVEVTGRDSLVFLSLGSEVAIINFADTANPKVLAEVQAMGLVAQAALRDSFLYIGCNSGQAGIEIWNIGNPSVPVFRSRTPTLLSDFCVRDTLLYLTQSLSGPNDTFKVYSIASPTNVYLLGSCRDSGDAVTVTNNAAFLADRWGLYSIDVSDPRNPHKVGTYPGMPISVEARGNICCVTFGNPNDPEWLEFDVLDVSNPASMQRLGYLSDAGGFDMFIEDSLVFISGYYTGEHEFQVVSIADSGHPVRVGACSTSGDNWGVWSCVARSWAYAADNYEGLAAIDLQNLAAPILDTTIAAAAFASDVSVAGSVCYVADAAAGMRILDLSDPTLPREIGAVDTTGDCYSQSVVAMDSFAFTDWAYPYLRAISVTDPAKPNKVGACIIFNRANDMVLRDSLLYVAEDDKFQIVNVAQPRAPLVVGTCNLPDYTYEMDMRDTLAFVASGVSGLQIVDVARPDSPAVIGALTPPNGACGVAVVDTFAYVASGNLYIASVAAPTSPYLIDSMALPNFGVALEVSDSLLFVGSWSVGASRTEVRLLDIRDPTKPVSLGSLGAPDRVRRLTWVEPHLFAACYAAGVLVVETAAVGVKEVHSVVGVSPELLVLPNPAGELARVEFGEPFQVVSRLTIYDAAGRQVMEEPIGEKAASIDLRLAGLNPGLYFIRVYTKIGVLRGKLVKR